MSLKVLYLELATVAYPDMKGQFIDQLGNMCGEKYEFRTRINSMQALQRLNACNKEIIANLFDCVLSLNSRLASPAKEVIQYFKKQTGFANMMKEESRKPRYSPEQKARITEALGN
jgi:hypothetical protein